MTHKTSVTGHCLFKASINILQSLGFVINVEKSFQPTKEIFLHLKPVKDFLKFKTRAIRHIIRILDLITSYLLRVKYGEAHYRRSEINKITKLRMKSLLNYIPYLLSCLVPRASRASCPTCSRVSVFRAHVLSCLTYLVPSVLSCLTYIISYMPYC